jgi:hypothetical protein
MAIVKKDGWSNFRRGRDQQLITLDGFRRCLFRELRIGPHEGRCPRLRATLFVEKSAHGSAAVRSHFPLIEWTFRLTTGLTGMIDEDKLPLDSRS